MILIGALRGETAGGMCNTTVVDVWINFAVCGFLNVRKVSHTVFNARDGYAACKHSVPATELLAS